MIVARIYFKIKDSSLAEFAQVSEEVSNSALDMEGCEQFAFYNSLSDKNKFILFEEWANKEAFSAYQESSAFKNSMSKLGPLLEGKPATRYYEGAITLDN